MSVIHLTVNQKNRVGRQIMNIKEPINTKAPQKYFTKIHQGMIQYGVGVLGGCGPAWLMSILLAHEFDKPGKQIVITHNQISRMMGVGRRQIQRYFDTLKAKAVISIDNRGRGEHAPNKYFVIHEALSFLLEEKRQADKDEEKGEWILEEEEVPDDALIDYEYVASDQC